MNTNQNQIEKAVKVLNDGGIIVFPTDTAFGIGCRMDKSQAIDRLFAIRNRPISQATPVLVSNRKMAETYFVDPSIKAINLMDMYWPGALTIVSRCDTVSVYSLVRGGRNTLGLRMPDHKTALEIISKTGVPLLGPSANFHGLATPYTFSSLDPALVKMVDFVVFGECSTKQASTVVDCTVEPNKIIRQGSVMI